MSGSENNCDVALRLLVHAWVGYSFTDLLTICEKFRGQSNVRCSDPSFIFSSLNRTFFSYTGYFPIRRNEIVPASQRVSSTWHFPCFISQYPSSDEAWCSFICIFNSTNACKDQKHIKYFLATRWEPTASLFTSFTLQKKKVASQPLQAALSHVSVLKARIPFLSFLFYTWILTVRGHLLRTC